MWLPWQLVKDMAIYLIKFEEMSCIFITVLQSFEKILTLFGLGSFGVPGKSESIGAIGMKLGG